MSMIETSQMVNAGNGEGHGSHAANGKQQAREIALKEFKYNVDTTPQRDGGRFKKVERKGKLSFIPKYEINRATTAERKAKISPETEQQYTELLSQHLTGLRNVDDALLEDLGFTSDLQLKKQFLDNNGEIKSGELAKLFQDARGFAYTTMFLEQQLAIGRLVVGWGTVGDRRTGVLAQEHWAFDMLSRNPKMAEYVKTMYNMDVNDFAWSATEGRVVERPTNNLATRGSRAQTSPDNTELRQHLKRMEDARTKFLTKDLGIPKQHVNQPQEAGLRHGYLNNSDLRWDRDVANEFAANEGGIRWMGMRLDNQGNLRRYMDAREAVMARTLGEQIQRRIGEPAGVDSRAKRLNQLATETAAGGSRDARLKGKFDEQIRPLDVDIDAAKGARESLDAVAQSRQAVEAAKSTAIDEAGTGVATYGDIQTTIDTKRKKITDRSDPDSIVRKRTALRDTANADIASIGSLPHVSRLRGSARVKEIARLTKHYQDKLTDDLEALDVDRTEIETEVTRLEGLQNRVRTAEQDLSALEGGTDATIDALKTSLDAIKRISVTLTDPTDPNIDPSIAALITRRGITGPPYLYEITEADLRSFSTKDLLERINEIHDASRTLGNIPVDSWGAEKNEDPSNRKRLALAQAEAQAMDASSAPTPKFTEFTGLGLTEGQMLTMTNQQINEFMNRQAALGLGGWPFGENDGRHDTEIDAARSTASDRVEQRREKLKALEDSKQADKRVLEAQRDSIDSSTGNERVKAAQALQGRKETIYTQAINIRSNIDALTSLAANSSVIDSQATSQELAGRAAWEIEWLQMLTGYKDEDNRAEAFAKASLQYNPEAVVRDVSDRLGIRWHGTPSIDQVLNHLYARVNGVDRHGVPLGPGFRRVTGTDMRRALRDYVNENADQVIRDLS